MENKIGTFFGPLEQHQSKPFLHSLLPEDQRVIQQSVVKEMTGDRSVEARYLYII